MPIQLIDPIKPRPRNRSSLTRPASDVGSPPNPRDFSPAAHTRTQSIDGVRRSTTIKSVQASTQPAALRQKHTQTSAVRSPKRLPQTIPTWRRILPGAIFGCGIVILGLLSWEPLIGQGLIVLYAVVALFTRIESRATFGLAVAALVAVAVAQLAAMPDKADTYAIFAYLLLCAGTLSFGLETWRTKRLQAKN